MAPTAQPELTTEEHVSWGFELIQESDSTGSDKLYKALPPNVCGSCKASGKDCVIRPLKKTTQTNAFSRGRCLRCKKGQTCDKSTVKTNTFWGPSRVPGVLALVDCEPSILAQRMHSRDYYARRNEKVSQSSETLTPSTPPTHTVQGHQADQGTTPAASAPTSGPSWKAKPTASSSSLRTTATTPASGAKPTKTATTKRRSPPCSTSSQPSKRAKSKAKAAAPPTSRRSLSRSRDQSRSLSPWPALKEQLRQLSPSPSVVTCSPGPKSAPTKPGPPTSSSRTAPSFTSVDREILQILGDDDIDGSQDEVGIESGNCSSGHQVKPSSFATNSSPLPSTAARTAHVPSAVPWADLVLDKSALPDGVAAYEEPEITYVGASQAGATPDPRAPAAQANTSVANNAMNTGTATTSTDTATSKPLAGDTFTTTAVDILYPMLHHLRPNPWRCGLDAILKVCELPPSSPTAPRPADVVALREAARKALERYADSPAPVDGDMHDIISITRHMLRVIYARHRREIRLPLVDAGVRLIYEQFTPQGDFVAREADPVARMEAGWALVQYVRAEQASASASAASIS